jgi:hypothetical protein
VPAGRVPEVGVLVAANEAVGPRVLLVAPPRGRSSLLAEGHSDDAVAHRRADDGEALGVQRVEQTVQPGGRKDHSVVGDRRRRRHPTSVLLRQPGTPPQHRPLGQVCAGRNQV